MRRPRVSSSAVRVFGAPVAPPHLEAVRARVGLLFQDPDDQLFCPTVWEDVTFGPRQLGLEGAELAGRARRALAQVGLAGFEDRLPHHLSRGEKRRVCLAGLLAWLLLRPIAPTPEVAARWSSYPGGFGLPAVAGVDLVPPADPPVDAGRPTQCGDGSGNGEVRS